MVYWSKVAELVPIVTVEGNVALDNVLAVSINYRSVVLGDDGLTCVIHFNLC